MRRPKNTAYAAIHPRARPDPAAPQDRGIVRAQHAARYPAQRRSVGVRLRGVWAITDRLNAQTHPEQSLILRQFREVPAAAADLLTQTQSGCRSCRTCCSVRRPAGAHKRDQRFIVVAGNRFVTRYNAQPGKTRRTRRPSDALWSDRSLGPWRPTRPRRPGRTRRPFFPWRSSLPLLTRWSSLTLLPLRSLRAGTARE